MLGYFVVAALAAFGTLCALWSVFGRVLLPEGKGCAVVCCGIPDDGILARTRWLRDMGLLDVPLLVVAEEARDFGPGTEICSREELLPRLEWERNQFHGTGTGDPTGRHQRRGISEL